MSEKEKQTTEIHKTEYVDKKIPTIVYVKTKQDDMTHGEHIKIEVSDRTSEGAFKTFKKIRNELKEEKIDE